MCGYPLGSGTVEEHNIEFSILNICGHCGFGLDLRWRGRGSALAQPTPNLVLISSEPEIANQLFPLLPRGVSLEAVDTAPTALGIYARSLRRETPLSAIFVLEKREGEMWSDVAVAIRSLEEGFRVNQSIPIWYVSSAYPSEQEQNVFENLSDIYWKECQEGTEATALMELAPQLFS